MAITIKNIPVLEGATAEDFVRSADKNAVKATPRLSATAKKRLQKVLDLKSATTRLYDTEAKIICIVSKKGAQCIECHHKDI